MIYIYYTVHILGIYYHYDIYIRGSRSLLPYCTRILDGLYLPGYLTAYTYQDPYCCTLSIVIQDNTLAPYTAYCTGIYATMTYIYTVICYQDTWTACLLLILLWYIYYTVHRSLLHYCTGTLTTRDRLCSYCSYCTYMGIYTPGYLTAYTVHIQGSIPHCTDHYIIG